MEFYSSWSASLRNSSSQRTLWTFMIVISLLMILQWYLFCTFLGNVNAKVAWIFEYFFFNLKYKSIQNNSKGVKGSVFQYVWWCHNVQRGFKRSFGNKRLYVYTLCAIWGLKSQLVDVFCCFFFPFLLADPCFVDK